jgi:arylsulfatase A-like enzyme
MNTMPPMRPNVLVVVLDAARRDALEPYGAPAGASPAVAQLAASGTALPEVYATGCWTAPSHASIFTGLMPRAAGLARVPAPSAAKAGMQPHRDRVLTEVLRREGYATAGASANLWVADGGFDIGFDEFESVDSGRVAGIGRSGARERIKWLAEAARARIDDGAEQVERIFDGWIGRPRRQPFFWFVNLIECHSPYLPPRGFGDVSLLDRLRAAEDARRWFTLSAIWKACVGGYDVPEETIERLRRMYAASIEYMDAWLGRLLEKLDGAGILDDTLVVVISDHGENFGEGGFLTHAHSLDNRLIHVPFVASGPGSSATEINSLADLPRFVAEAVGLGEHPWTDGPPEGIGVAQFDAPVDPGDQRAIDLVAEWGLGDDALERFTMPLTAAVRGHLKLMRRGEDEVVYDLRDDPLELSPIPAGAAEARLGEHALAPLRAALEHPSMRVGGVLEEAKQGPSEDELREIEDRMRLLGYM